MHFCQLKNTIVKQSDRIPPIVKANAILKKLNVQEIKTKTVRATRCKIAISITYQYRTLNQVIASVPLCIKIILHDKFQQLWKPSSCLLLAIVFSTIIKTIMIDNIFKIAYFALTFLQDGNLLGIMILNIKLLLSLKQLPSSEI